MTNIETKERVGGGTLAIFFRLAMAAYIRLVLVCVDRIRGGGGPWEAVLMAVPLLLAALLLEMSSAFCRLVFRPFRRRRSPTR
jgi:hypothetical protein